MPRRGRVRTEGMTTYFAQLRWVALETIELGSLLRRPCLSCRLCIRPPQHCQAASPGSGGPLGALGRAATAAQPLQHTTRVSASRSHRRVSLPKSHGTGLPCVAHDHVLFGIPLKSCGGMDGCMDGLLATSPQVDLKPSPPFALRRHRWDGVDRSNGYEKQFFEKQAQARRQATVNRRLLQ